MKQTITLLFLLCMVIGTDLKASPPEVTVSNWEAMGMDGEYADSVTRIPGLSFKVYPNPATDYIRVEWEAGKHIEVYAEIYDLVGRRISRHQSDSQQNRIQIELQDLQRSAYLLKVYTNDRKYSRTFRVVKH